MSFGFLASLLSVQTTCDSCAKLFAVRGQCGNYNSIKKTCASESLISTTFRLNVGWQQKVNTPQLTLRCKFIMATGFWGSLNCIWASLSSAERVSDAKLLTDFSRNWTCYSFPLGFWQLTTALGLCHRHHGIIHSKVFCFDCWRGHFLETPGAAISSLHCRGWLGNTCWQQSTL